MFENKRILVVDDDPGVRDSYAEILMPASRSDVMETGAFLFGESDRAPVRSIQKTYDLTMVDRGEKAVHVVEAALTEEQRFAAAFIDMNMPGIDGAETSKRIWSIDPHIKIIIVTAYSEYTPDDIIRVTERDDLFYLRKPYNPEEIRQFARVTTTEWNLERERRYLSDQLRSVNDELEQINTHLQEKIKEQAAMLIQSEKMASIGILAAGVAHEINNPVSFVNGNLTTLKKYCERIGHLLNRYKTMETCIREGGEDRADALMEEIREFKEKHNVQFMLDDMVDLADESLEGTRRIINIVRDLKTFSRIDEAELTYINIADTLDAALNIIHNELKNKAEIRKGYGELPQIKCFPHKISQVFMNLLMNALQAIEGKGIIEIVTRHVKNGRRVSDNFVEVRISDSGCGIPEENLSKIFDPFFTTKPVGEGTGLGLSITYDIIKAHGGHIRVESKVGSGATFIIELPIVIPATIIK